MNLNTIYTEQIGENIFKHSMYRIKHINDKFCLFCCYSITHIDIDQNEVKTVEKEDMIGQFDTPEQVEKSFKLKTFW